MSELILAASACRTSVTETVQSAATLPTGGQWGANRVLRVPTRSPSTCRYPNQRIRRYSGAGLNSHPPVINATCRASTSSCNRRPRGQLYRSSGRCRYCFVTCGPQSAQTRSPSTCRVPAALAWRCKVPSPKARASRSVSSRNRTSGPSLEEVLRHLSFLCDAVTAKMRWFQLQQVLPILQWPPSTAVNAGRVGQIAPSNAVRVHSWDGCG